VSRPSQIRFLSRSARLYDPVVRAMGFSGLWHELARRADPAPGAPCLDVCAGTGGVALALAARGAQVLGVDLAAGMLGQARRKAREQGLAARIRLARMDARRLAIPDRSFPLVTCAMALHEMAEAERARVLEELARVASGRVVVAEYRVPERPLARAAFLLTHAFEFLESDDFARFLARPMPERLEAAGLGVETASDAGPYRIWSCRVSA